MAKLKSINDIKRKVNLSKREAEEWYNDIEIIDSFLHGIEISKDESIFRMRQNLFEIKGFFLTNS